MATKEHSALNVDGLSDGLDRVLHDDSLRKMLYNPTTGLGGQKDKTVDVQIDYVPMLTHEEATYLYTGSNICAKVVDVPADAMTREWSELKLNLGDSHLIDDFENYETDLNTQNSFHEAITWAFLYGGAAIVIGVNDGRMMAEPVDINNIESIDWLMVVDRYSISPYDFSLYHLRRPEFYQMLDVDNDVPPEFRGQVNILDIIHHSRVLRFEGPALPKRIAESNSGWGDSKLRRFYYAFANYFQANDATTQMILNFDVFIHAINGLEQIVKGGKAKEFREYIQEVHWLKSVYGVLLMDGKVEQGKFVSRSMGGLGEALEALERRLTMEADMPHMELWGTVGKAGLGDSGDAERLAWANKIGGLQKRMVLPPLRQLYKLFFACKSGPTKGKPPKELWKVGFKSLFILNPVQKAEVVNKSALAVEKLINNKIIVPAEARTMFDGPEFRSEITLSEKVEPIFEYTKTAQPPSGAAPRDTEKETARKKERKEELALQEGLDTLPAFDSLEKVDGRVFYKHRWWVPNVTYPSTRKSKTHMALINVNGKPVIKHYNSRE